MQPLSLHQALLAITALTPLTTLAAPTRSCLSDPSCGPIPGGSTIYSTTNTTSPPWPGYVTGAILPTTTGPPGEDDLLFQNLLSAEWIIFYFYQQGVERFSQEDFVSAGFPETTYDRIREIRNNEAGHLRIFQDQISTNSIKPGPCKYQFPFNDPASFLLLQTVIEVSSMAFLTGLELEAKSQLSRGAIVAIASTESRHNTWSLIDNWAADPFAGPSDTYYPYAKQILAYTDDWIVNGSCPSQNPSYPYPNQDLPGLDTVSNTTKSLAPGAPLELKLVPQGGQPAQLDDQQDLYAVFFHGVLNASMPIDTKTMKTNVPSDFEARGIYVLVLATEEGAPTQESVVAGPLILLAYPEKLGLEIA